MLATETPICYNQAASMRKPTSVEICAGAGGQALGLEMAGFEHVALIEIDKHACATLRLNRPDWNVLCMDVHHVKGEWFPDVDLLAGGVPCPPFSVAGKQLGDKDERNLFPEAIRLAKEINPRAIMLENVRGLMDPQFDWYRAWIADQLGKLGYAIHWKLLQSSEYGVSQLRPRVLCVGIRRDISSEFVWPTPNLFSPPSVGNLLYDLMAENGWEGVEEWKNQANDIAPTLVGGSKKHGGADLGPTRTRKKWEQLGVDGSGVADAAPDANFQGAPKLTTRMAARIQGFPDSWNFFGKKTSTYRQIGNAFPPPVACAVGKQIFNIITRYEKNSVPGRAAAFSPSVAKVNSCV